MSSTSRRERTLATGSTLAARDKRKAIERHRQLADHKQGRDALIRSWDAAATPKAKRKAIERRLQLACHLAQLSSDAPAHKVVGSVLGRGRPGSRWLRTLETHHLAFITEVHGLLTFVTEERAWGVIFGRMQTERGKRRPKHSFVDLAGDLGITDRHAKRLYEKALDEIAAGLDGLAIVSRICSGCVTFED